ncbi:MAG: PDZ domain-containing protein, partial [Lysobacter sp.]|nr:PDZ domain-containing protein [Lysobacter sp.]
MRKTPLAFLLLLAAGAAFAQQAPEQETPPQQAPEQQAPEQQVSTSDDPDAAESTTSKVPLDEIRRYVWVYNAVKEAYVDPVDDKKLMQAAVRGLLLDLDPHSAYLPKRDAKAFDEVTQGAYTGVGVELMTLPDRTLKVVSPIDDTPAARAGIKAGDIVTAIDGKPVADRDASNDGDDDDEGDGNSAPLRGAPGTKVVLTIQREGRAKPFDVTLTRERIRVTSVKSRTLEPGFGYIRIATFQADTAADFSRAIDTLQAGGPLRGLVLDLRSNPGGLLTAAVQIADELLDKGKIVSTRGRVALSDAEFSAT